MNKSWKRLMSILLSIVMIISYTPMRFGNVVYAQENNDINIQSDSNNSVNYIFEIVPEYENYIFDYKDAYYDDGKSVLMMVRVYPKLTDEYTYNFSSRTANMLWSAFEERSTPDGEGSEIVFRGNKQFSDDNSKQASFHMEIINKQNIYSKCGEIDFTISFINSEQPTSVKSTYKTDRGYIAINNSNSMCVNIAAPYNGKIDYFVFCQDLEDYEFVGWKIEGEDDTLYVSHINDTLDEKQTLMKDYVFSKDVVFVAEWKERKNANSGDSKVDKLVSAKFDLPNNEIITLKYDEKTAYGQFNRYQYIINGVLSLVYESGKEEKYTYCSYEIPNSGQTTNTFVNQDDNTRIFKYDYVDSSEDYKLEDSNIYVSLKEKSDSTTWEKGKEYAFVIIIKQDEKVFSTDIPVYVSDTTSIDSISFNYPYGNNGTIKENTCGFINGMVGYHTYDFFKAFSGGILTLTYSDETTQVYNANDYGFYDKDNNHIKYSCSIDDDQLTSQWTTDNKDCHFEINIAGHKCDVPVSITKAYTITIKSEEGYINGVENDNQLVLHVSAGEPVYSGKTCRNRPGYICYGYKNEETDEIFNDIELSEFIPTENTSFIALWKKAYNVTWDANGGFMNTSHYSEFDYFYSDPIIVDQVDCELQEGISYVRKPVYKEGCVFIGWKVDGDNENVLYVTDEIEVNSDNKRFIGDYILNSDVTFCAQWEKGNTITIKSEEGYIWGDSDRTKVEWVIPKHEALNFSNIASCHGREGYGCSGYFVGESGDFIPIYELYSYVPDGDITLIPKWEKAYKVTWNTNEGDKSKVFYSQIIKGFNIGNEQPYPSADGKTLIGWKNDTDGSIYQVPDDTVHDEVKDYPFITSYVVTDNVTFSAIWKENNNICGHKNTELRNKVAETCKNDGYSGDKYCLDCEQIIETGKVVTKIGHKWDEGKITQSPTSALPGTRTYTCTVCGETKTEEIPKLPAEEKKQDQKKEDDKKTEDKKTDTTQPSTSSQTTPETYSFEATVQENTGSTVLVKGLSTNNVNYRGSFYLTISKNTVIEKNGAKIDISKLTKGTQVTVYYSGTIAETSPGQIFDVRKIVITKEATTPKTTKAPSKPTLSPLKNTKGKKMVIKWKKVKNAKGYQVEWALDSKFKKSKKSKTLSQLTFTAKNLKKSKTYYVRVRAYTKDSKGKKVYGKWSTVKKITIKK